MEIYVKLSRKLFRNFKREDKNILGSDLEVQLRNYMVAWVSHIVI